MKRPLHLLQNRGYMLVAVLCLLLLFVTQPVSSNGSNGVRLKGVNPSTAPDAALHVETLKKNALLSGLISGNKSASINQVQSLDTDGDGIPDATDADDDNDGITDIAECNQSNFYWSNPPSVSGYTATGTINGINYTYTSSQPISTTGYMYANSVFPASYGVPNANPTIANIYVTSNTLSFSSPMTNPVLVFASIGQPGVYVPITFSAPIQVVWSQAVVQNSSTQITGNEGYAIIRLMGTFTSISFNYLAQENWCNFAFGADFQSCPDTDNDGIADNLDTDSDNDGCPDALEGSGSFTMAQISNGQLTGSVSSTGIPTLAGSGQAIGNSKIYAANCFCQPGNDNVLPILTAPANITMNIPSCQAVPVNVNLGTATATDNCGPVTVTNNAPGSFGLGTTTVTWRAVDAQNNVTLATQTVTITRSDALSLTSTKDINCSGPNSGSITANASGGRAPLTYQLNSGAYQSSNTFTNLAPGVYSLTVKDADNCTLTQNQITLVEPFCLQAVNDSFENCAGRSITIQKSTLLGNDANPWNVSIYMDVAQPANGTIVDNGSSITYTPNANFSGTDQFNYTIKKNDGTIAFAGNGHVYEWVPAYAITWNSARIGAGLRYYNGMQGYLVTVTSAAEMSFVASKLQGSGWMGASDRAYEGTWRWVTGPEGLEDGGLGRHFSNQFKSPYGNCAASTAPALIGQYANWATNEPNDCGAYLNQYTANDQNRGGEHYAHFYGGGVWNDYPDNVGGSIQGYIVEYGGLEGPLASTGTSTAKVVINSKKVIIAETVSNETCAGAANGSIALNVSGGTAPYSYNWGGGVTSANRTGLTAGNYTVTVTDAKGCTATKTIAVLMVDNLPPVAIAKNITVSLNGTGSVSITAAQVDNGSNDACGIQSMTVSPASFGCANIGPNIVTLTVTDIANNSSTAQAVVTVEDVTPPVLICPADINVSASATSCDAFVNIAPPAVTDNCSTLNNALSFDGINDYVTIPRSVSGDFTIEYWMKTTQTGSSGGQWWAGYGVVDAEVGSVTNDFGTTLNGNKIAFGTGGSFDATIFSTSAVNTGNWVHVAVTRKQSTGAMKLYINGVQEASGTGSTNSLTTPAYIRMGVMQTMVNGYFNGTLDEVRIWNTVRTASEISTSMNASFSGSLPSGLVAYYTINQGVAGGPNNLASTLFDAAGANNGTLTNFALSGPTSNYVDGTTGIPSLTLSNNNTSTSNASGVYPVGTTTLTWTAKDASGNTTTCTQKVNVTDNSVPNVLTKNITVYLDANGQAALTPSMINNGSNDNCGIASMNVSPSTLSCSNLSVTNGGAGTFSATMTVDNQYSIYVTTDDNVQGTAFGSGNNWGVASSHSTSLTPGVVNYIHVLAQDVGGPEMFIGDFSVSGAFKFANGTQSAKSNASDWKVSSGGWSGYGTPLEISSSNYHGIWGTINGISSSAKYIWSSPWNNGGADVRYFTIAVYPVITPANVTLSVTDIHGNTGTAGAQVTVIDNIPPSLSCPANISTYATSAAGATVNYTEPVGTDNCAVTTVRIAGPASGSTFPIGVTTVTYKATDASGLSATCSFTVDVVGLPPVIQCPSNITVNNTAGQCGANVNYTATETTAIPASTITYSIAPGSNFNVGTTTVTATATNPVGTSSCTFTVTVLDNEAPAVQTQNVTLSLDANGSASTSASQVNNGSTDNCGIASISLSKTSFDCSDVGANTVTLSVTDIHGNTATANATVTVQDLIAPTAMAQNVTVTLANGAAGVTASQINNGSFDNCGIASMTVSPSSFNCSHIGNNTVTLTVTDLNGNVSTTTATVTVVGVIPACSITSAPNNSGTVIGSTYTLAGVNQMYLGYGAQSMVLTCSASGAAPFTYSWTGSGLSSNTVANPVFTPTAGGNYTFVCTVTNAYGCQTTCRITICVLDIRVSGGSPNNPKVMLCHVPPGNPNNTQSLSISISAVPAHLTQHAGDRLGSCNMTCGYAKSDVIGDLYSEETPFGEVELIVYPNPSSTNFTFKLESNSDEPVSFQLYDISGRLIIDQSNLSAKQTMTAGDDLSTGMYTAVITQGSFSKSVKVTKIR